MSAYQSFRPVAQFIFWQKYHFQPFFYKERVWPYGYAFNVPLMILILNMCVPGFSSIFLAKIPILALLIQKGVWPYKHAHDVPLVTQIGPTPCYLQRVLGL